MRHEGEEAGRGKGGEGNEIERKGGGKKKGGGRGNNNTTKERTHAN